MRVRNKRRRFMILLKISFVLLCLVFIRYIIRSHYSKDTEPIKTKKKPIVYVVENEIDIFDYKYNDYVNSTAHNLFYQKHGTLISVNSHCDDGLYMPWETNFTSIINKNEVLHKLKSIPLQTVYPGASGLFKEVMCVYPWWKPSNDVYKHDKHYLCIWDEALFLCSIIKNTTFNDSSYCRVVKSGEEMLLNSDGCQPLGERWETKVMQDIYAQTKTKDTSITSPTMVSIHLDFFIVDSVDKSVLSSDIITTIEKQIRELLCPYKMLYEASIDSWFQKVLKLKSTSSENIDSLIFGQNLPFCTQKRARNRSRIKTLLSTVLGLTDLQRCHLSSAGLCMQFTSKLNIISIVVCVGQLSRRLSSETLHGHTAGKEEIALQMEKLTHFLKVSVSQPRLITIVRSARLGVLSYERGGQLEAAVLAAVQSVYGLHDNQTVYLPSLFRGARTRPNIL